MVAYKPMTGLSAFLTHVENYRMMKAPVWDNNLFIFSLDSCMYSVRFRVQSVVSTVVSFCLELAYSVFVRVTSRYIASSYGQRHRRGSYGIIPTHISIFTPKFTQNQLTETSEVTKNNRSIRLHSHQIWHCDETRQGCADSSCVAVVLRLIYQGPWCDMDLYNSCWCQFAESQIDRLWQPKSWVEATLHATEAKVILLKVNVWAQF